MVEQTNSSMNKPRPVKLTAPEIANIWSQYQNDTLAICVYKYMLETVEEESIRDILQFALRIAEGHIVTITQYFKDEGFPIPHGFTEDDVYLNAPRLFSDTVCLTYTYIMSVNGLAGYAAALTTNVRRDIRDYFVICQEETMKLFNTSLDLLLEKGIVARPPTINPANSFSFIEKQTFLSNFLGGNRPLSAIEISHLFWDLKKISLSKAFTMAFSQVAKSEEVRNFLWRGSEMYTKHLKVFQDTLIKEQLPSPKTDDSEITSSTTAPFSDRLLMFHKALFSGTTISFYGVAIGTCQRADLVANYTRLAGEMVKYMEDGMNILIKNKWIEEPPLNDDREKLAKGK